MRRTKRLPSGADRARPTAWKDPLLWARAGLVLALLVFVPDLLEQFEAPKVMVVRALGLGALAAALVSWRELRRLPWQPLDLAVAAWLMVELLASMFSVAPRLSVLGDTDQHEGLLTSLGLAGLYLAARWGASSPGRIRVTLHLAAAAAALASLYALAQVAGLDPLHWTRTAGYGVRGVFVRPFGTLGHPNVLGVVSAAMLASSITLVVGDGGKRWLHGVAAVVLALATALTLSRGAWLGALAGLLGGGMFVLAARRVRDADRDAVRGRGPRLAALAPGILALGALLFAVILGGGALRARVAELVSPASGSALSRREIWRSALACWRARPWLGQGPDTFSLVFPRYQTPEYWQLEWGSVPFHAHSVYLHDLATRGIAGGLTLIVAAFALGSSCRRAWRSSPEARRLMPALLAVFSALAVAGASGVFGMAGAVLLLLCAAAVASLAEAATPAAPARPRAAGTPALFAFGTLAALSLVWSAGDLASSRFALTAQREKPLLGNRADAARAARAADRAASMRPGDDAMQQRRSDLYLALSQVSPNPAGPLREAEASARRAIALMPSRAINHLALGAALMARAAHGDSAVLPSAETAYARCFELAPWDGLKWMQLAYEELDLHRARTAWPLAQRAARQYPRVGLAQMILARACLGVEDTAGARGALERMLALDWPSDADARPWARRMLESLGTPSPRRR